jgi:hypothetical protein
MSLTSFVELPDVKERLHRDVVKPWFRVRSEIKAPPLTTSYGLTGTAFDYLLRFYIEKLNPDAKRQPWVAETSLAILALRSPKSAALRRSRRIVATAKERYDAYLKTSRMEKPGEGLIRAAINLAQLDLVYRIGLVDLRPIDEAVVQDLAVLFSLVHPEDFRAKRVCVLNPTFGSASRLVGGADADLFIDGTLIDIKASKHLSMKRDVFNQLFGYYWLSCIGGVYGCRAKVSAVGVYYARYGLLHRMTVKSFMDPRRFPTLLRWLKRRAREKFGQPPARPK